MKAALILLVLIVSLLFVPMLTAFFNDPPENLFAEGTTLHDMGDVLHDPDTLANINTRITDAVLDDINDTRTPAAHNFGNGVHTSSSLADINILITDAVLDDTMDERPPKLHVIASHSDTTASGAELNELTDASETSLHSHASASIVQSLWAQPHFVRNTGVLDTYIETTSTSTIGDATNQGSAYISISIPSNFVSIVSAYVVVIAAETGNIRYSVDAGWGADSELIFIHADSISTTTKAVSANTIYDIDVSAALTNIEADDRLGLEFKRRGDDALDTITTLHVVGFLFEYNI